MLSARPVEPARSERSERLRGIAALVFVQFCFGMFPIFAVWAFAAFEPRAVAFWRIAAGAAVLGTFAWLRHGRAALPRRADLGLLFCCSMLGVALNQSFFLEGLRRSTAANAGLIMCLIPVFTYGLAVLWRRERLRILRCVGIAIALCATAPLFLAEGNAGWSDDARGNALLMSNALFYSIYLVLSKPLLTRYRPLVVIAWVYVFSLPALAWFGVGVDLVPGPGASEDVANLAWRGLVLALVFPTILAYLFNTWALARVNASTAAFFVYMQPVITALASHFILHEDLTGSVLQAGLALFVGLWLVLQRRF